MAETRIVCVANRKGGVGKSTVTMLLASAMAKDGKKVVVLDTDSQNSVADTLRIEKTMYPDSDPLVDVEAIAPRYVSDFLRFKASNYDVVFIDPPRITEAKTDDALALLVAFSDLVLIPVLGSQVDVMSTAGFIDLVKRMAEHKESNNISFQYFGFINRMNRRKDNEQAFQYLDKIGLPMLDSSLGDLKVFASPSLFFSVMDTKEGMERFQDFYKDVLSKLN